MTTEELKSRGIRRIVSFECSDGYKTTDPEDAERHEDSLWTQALSADMARVIREEVQKAFSQLDWSKIQAGKPESEHRDSDRKIYIETYEKEEPEDETTRQIHDIIRERLEIPDEESIEDTDRIITDLGADSLDTIELVMDAERKFDIHITDEECMRLRRVGEVIALIKEKIKEKKK